MKSKDDIGTKSFIYDLISVGFGFFFTGIFLYTDLWSIEPSSIYIKTASTILKNSKLYGLTPLYLIFIGLFILFIATTIKYSVKDGWSYVVSTIVSVVAFILLFLGWLAQARITWVTILALLIVMSWCSYTFIFYLKRLYAWITDDKDKSLAKLTFIWTILAAIFGYFLGKNE